MTLDLVVNKTDDGFTGEIPSLKGCETWAPDEEAVIVKVIELASFYLSIPKEDMKVDKARGSRNKTVYKLIFHK